MASIIIATPSPFREFLFSGLVKKDDFIIYEKCKDFTVDYDTSFYKNEISEYLKKNYTCQKSICQYRYISNINDSSLIELLQTNKNIEKVILTGANYLKGIQYESVSQKVKHILNIHMGDPNKFRGLDSNFWALSSNPDSNASVTLHYANKNLDTGEIIYIERSKKKFKDMTLKELISFEVEAAKRCLEKSINLSTIQREHHKIINKGLYKGAMSSIDKQKTFLKLKGL